MKEKNSNMKKLSVFILSLILIFTMVSCGDNDEKNMTSDKTDITVTIEIDFPDDSGVQDIDNAQVSVSEGNSVLDVLNTYGEENSVDITLDERSESPYVISISGVEATGSSGWVYELNDETVMESADKCTVQDGDKVDWSFESWDDDSDED